MRQDQKSSRTHRIERRTIPENIRNSLQERILNGEFREGDPLVQEIIAEEYDVSRIPVREALRQLEASGLVVIQTHKGAVVATIPTEQVEELFELRAMLEVDLLERAIPRMTDRDIAEAGDILTELEASFARGDRASWGRLNSAFHRRLYAPAGRPQTLALLQGIGLQAERYIRLHLVLTDGLDDALREHREILRLCAMRDVAAAASYLRDHILQAGRALVAELRAERARRTA
ncbi:GntR family transcriptional regulator [Sphingomonas sp. dw_22]|uniref:GntR family transcriptional regulator n=1 Tax=Sphingomonas sp. dw_22 TaxID=2721175 RepID=UPI001BD57F20|nr:GntR family transcriptional regulator [Sphingomonas sp. dw_22]